MERNSFVFYRSFYEAVKDLDQETRLAYYEALMRYALNGEEPQDNVIVKSLLNLVKPQIEANNRKYENGKKGGRPKKEAPEAAVGESEADILETKNKPNDNLDETKKNQNKPNETKINQTKPNESNPKPNVNVNENENVNVNDNVLKEKQKKEKSDDFCVCEKTIEYLNEKCGTKYDPENEELHKQIKDRIREGHTLEEFKSVIDKKSRDWINTSMERHLNPVTLFKTIKFDVYLGEPDKKASSVKAFPVTPPMMENGQRYDAMEELLIEN